MHFENMTLFCSCSFILYVIYIFVNAQKVVHPRGLHHMIFVISAVTTTQCSLKKLKKLNLTKNHDNHTSLLAVDPRSSWSDPRARGSSDWRILGS